MEPQQRAELAQRMALQVVLAARPLPTFVVCDNEAVASWAVGVGASVLWRPANGLNSAVSQGRNSLRAAGFDRLIIAHGDLPFATELAWVDQSDGITIVTDRRQDGTNVMALPTDADFVFAYGAGSAAKHAAEAERIGLHCNIVLDAKLGWDVDVPEDLVGPDFDANLSTSTIAETEQS